MQEQKGIEWNVASVKREGPEAVRVRLEPKHPPVQVLQQNLAGGYGPFAPHLPSAEPNLFGYSPRSAGWNTS